MINTELITKHINFKVDIVKQNGICGFCGKEIKEGILKEDFIKQNFTDFEYIKYKSNIFCKECYISMANCIDRNGKKSCLRNYSFIADDKQLILLTKEKMKYYLFEYKFNKPFIFCITFNGKKHLSFKSKVNYDINSFIITTDLGNVFFIRNRYIEIYKIIEEWFKIFNKKEILTIPKFSNIEKYGVRKYFEENERIKLIKDTLIFKILVFSLFKEDKNVKN